MDLVLSLGQTALELGLICSLTVLALFLSYTMLNVCDLSTDGCFTLGAAVGAAVALAGHPWLSIPAAMAAGVCSGFLTAFLQTRMGVDSLLAGIIVNTGLYSVNIAVMEGASLLNLNKADTIFSIVKDWLAGTHFSGQYKLIVALAAVAVTTAFLTIFLNTRLGLSIRATGDNPDMVRSSSVNPVFTTTVGLCVANAFTGLSGCLLAQSQKSTVGRRSRKPYDRDSNEPGGRAGGAAQAGRGPGERNSAAEGRECVFGGGQRFFTASRRKSARNSE